ncbi:MAG: hypothetical protein AB7P07_08765 [Hyphomonadaceae bacterium]
MRFLILAACAVLAACAASGGGAGAPGDNPFPIARGSAIPPPEMAASAQSAPPEGRGPSGVDFGQWRSVDPAAYGPQFQAQMRTRYAGQSLDQIRADLAANGFSCGEGARLDCRIEIMERSCARDWYVVVERSGAEPVAGFDVMCLGAN